MAEKTIFDPRYSRGTEAPSRRLPFAPIFDTIVAEPLPQRPLTTEEPVTKVFPLPREGNGFRVPPLEEPQNRPKETSSGNRRFVWVIGAGLSLLVAGIVFQNFQLARQQQTLTQLVQGTSKLASSLTDARAAQERPWLTLSDLTPQPLSVAPGSFGVAVQNAGKTPAVDVKIAAMAQVTNVPNASSLPPIEPLNYSAGTIFPGAQFRTILAFQPSAPVFTALFRSQGRLEIHVNVTYEDVQRGTHVTQSCWQWIPASRRMEPCSGFGTIN